MQTLCTSEPMEGLLNLRFLGASPELLIQLSEDGWSLRISTSNKFSSAAADFR